MCDLQFNLLNHIANTIINLQNKHNALTKIVLKKDDRGSELIDLFKKEYEKKRKVSEQSSSLYQ